MKAEDLKNSILQMAMGGKLVPQDPNDEPASVLLEKIHNKKEKLIKEKKIKRNNKESFIFRKNGHFYEKVGKKGEPVCIDDEIPFDIPDSWEWVRINTIREVYTGNSINKTEKETKFTGLTEGYNYIATKDVKFDNSIDYDNGVKIPKDLEKFRVAPFGSVLLCIEGGSAGRKIGILNQDVCFGNKLVCFKTFNESNDFLFYYLQSPNFKEIFKSKKTGIIGGVGIAKLRNVLMPIPPFNEQKRIIKKLQNIFQEIKEYESHEEKLSKLNSEFPDKLRSSILQEAIQGKLVPQDPNDEPASVLLEKIKEEKERLIKEKKIKRNKNESYIFKENNQFHEKIGNKVVCINEEILFQIPKSWNWVRLGDIVYNFGQKKPDKTFSYIDVGSIDNKNLRLNQQENILTKDKAPSRARKIIKEGSIIYSTVRPYLLNMCIIDKKFSHEPIASTAFAILNPFKGVNNKYLFYYLQSPMFINYVNRVMSGVAYPAINDKKLYNALITLPPLEEQKRIVEKIDLLIEELNFKS